MSKLPLIQDIDSKVDKSYVDINIEALSNRTFGVKNPNYKENIDELFKAGQYILQNPFSGTMPNNQVTERVQWGILNVYGGGESGSQTCQDLTTTNHSAYGDFANRYYRRIRFGNKWSEWKELANAEKYNMKSYTNYASLGITAKWNSIEECVSSLPNDSEGVFDIQGNFNDYATLFPTASGLLTVTKQNGNRCYLLFTQSVNNTADSSIWYSWYRDAETIKYTWQELFTPKNAMTKIPLVRDIDLAGYLTTLEQSCTFYVHNSCTNTPLAGKYFICQVFCHANQVNGSDKHIAIQEFTSKRQFFADSWNREAIVWKEYAVISKVDNLPLLNNWACNSAFPKLSLHRSGNMATITGVLQSGTKTSGTTIFTIPAGYRPTQGVKALQVAYTGNTLADQEPVRVAINSSGTVVIDTTFTKPNLAISLTYPIEE